MKNRLLALLRTFYHFVLFPFNYFILLQGKKFSGKLLILVLHRVLPDKNHSYNSLPGMYITPKNFRKMIQYLLKLEFEFINFDDLNNAKLKQRNVILTFDDGWKDNLIYAIPILEQYNIPATIFVNTASHIQYQLPWYDHLYQILIHKREDEFRNVINNLSKEPINDFDIKQLVNDSDKWDNFINSIKFKMKKNFEKILQKDYPINNHQKQFNLFLNSEDINNIKNKKFKIENHGYSHKILTEIQNDEIVFEIENSYKQLEKNFGILSKVFAYPNGNYNQYIIDVLKYQKYQFAVTTERGINNFPLDNDAYKLKRLTIHDALFTSFARFLTFLVR